MPPCRPNHYACGGSASLGGLETQLAFATEPAKITHIVWEDSQGRFLKAAKSTDRQLQHIPAGAARLYLLAAQGENAELASFLAPLGGSFTSSPRPSFLPSPAPPAQRSVSGDKRDDVAALQPGERAIGDNVKPVTAGTVRPKDKPKEGRRSIVVNEAAVSVCQYEVAAATPLDTKPFR